MRGYSEVKNSASYCVDAVLAREKGRVRSSLDKVQYKPQEIGDKDVRSRPALVAVQSVLTVLTAFQVGTGRMQILACRAR